MTGAHSSWLITRERMENGEEAREIGWIVFAPFISVTSSSIVSTYFLLIKIVSEPEAGKDRGISVVAGKSATWRGVQKVPRFEYRGTFCTPLLVAGCWPTCFPITSHFLKRLRSKNLSRINARNHVITNARYGYHTHPRDSARARELSYNAHHA